MKKVLLLSTMFLAVFSMHAQNPFKKEMHNNQTKNAGKLRVTNTSSDLPERADVYNSTGSNTYEDDPSGYYLYTYDSKGRILSSKYYNKSGETYTFSSGTLYGYTDPPFALPEGASFEEQTYIANLNAAGEITSSDSIAYTFTGNNLTKKESFYNGTIERSEEYTYNESGICTGVLMYRCTAKDVCALNQQIEFDYSNNTATTYSVSGGQKTAVTKFINVVTKTGSYLPYDEETLTGYDMYALNGSGELFMLLEKKTPPYIEEGVLIETENYSEFVCDGSGCQSTVVSTISKTFQLNDSTTVTEQYGNNGHVLKSKYYVFTDSKGNKSGDAEFNGTVTYVNFSKKIYDASDRVTMEYVYQATNSGDNYTLPASPSRKIVYPEFNIVTSTNTFVNESTVTVFPNPAIDYINIPEGNFVIRDISGRLVKAGISSGKIEISNLETGAYLLNIDNHKPARFSKR